MNPYGKLSDNPIYREVMGPGDGPQWKDREVVGGGPGQVEIRKAPHGLLISIDSQKCGADPVPPGETIWLSVSSVIPWIGTGFSVSAECAHRFVLKSMRHAMREYVPDQPIACTLFSDAQCCECRAPKVKRHLPKEWPTVMVGCPIELEIENIGDQPSHFRATFEAIRIPMNSIY